LWPDSSEDQALANLRTLLFHLRRNLPLVVPYIRVERNTLQWHTDDSLEIDALQFEHALAQADQAEKQGDARAQVKHLQNAVDLYRGDLLPSFYEEWILAERETLQQRFASALETLITLLERHGNVQGAIGAAQRLLRHNPLHEAIYTRLMELYAATGMVAEALRVYHTCATTLERELGVEPGANTRQAYERLLNTRRVPGQVSAKAPGTAEQRPRPQVALNPQAAPLTGRAGEWALLVEAWQAAAQGHEHGGGMAVLVRGEAGIGKTRLVEELFNWVARQGVAAASARCYLIERRSAFGPVADWLQTLPMPTLSAAWLSEVARLRPDILADLPGVPAPGPLTEAWQRRRFMEAISRVLLANRLLLLTLDDLQWCDLDTLEFLHFLLRAPAEANRDDPYNAASGMRLLLVMTARIEVMDIDTVRDAERAEALTQLLDGLRDRDQLLEIDLTPLSQEDTAELASTLSGGQSLDPSNASALYRETEGNPLFIVEMLRSFRMRNISGLSNPNSAFHVPHSMGLPPRITRVLKTRLGQLSTQARELVDFAAVIGRDFTLPLLKLASGENESAVVSCVDELWQHRIVREQGEGGYDFSHDKLREVAYSSLSAARREWLHNRIAQALEAGHAEDLDRVSGQIGFHYERAGLRAEAAHYYRRAAAAARRIYSNQEAIAYFRRALELGEPTAGKAQQDRTGDVAQAQSYEGMADVMEWTGQNEQARSAYAQALAHVPESESVWRSRLQRKVAWSLRNQGLFTEALQVLLNAEEALEGMRNNEKQANISHSAFHAPHSSEWWQEWVQIQLDHLDVLYNQARASEMPELIERTRQAVEEYATLPQRIEFYRALVEANHRRDRYAISEETMGYYRAALAAAEESGNADLIAQTQFRMGFGLMCRRDLDAAEEKLLAALGYAERTGRLRLQAVCLVYLSTLHRLRGQVQEVRDLSVRSMQAAGASETPTYIAASRANLAWAAWRDGDVDSAWEEANAAIESWGQMEMEFPFRWLAGWPLIAIQVSRHLAGDAVELARELLQPTQQRMLDKVEVALEDAIGAWGMSDSGGQQEAEALSCLQQAISRAREIGYL
jgi:DNA-binding SARP family transcriptional activator